MSTERLADRTNVGPDYRHPDDVALPGIAPDPDAWAPEPFDLDTLVRPPRVVTVLDGVPVRTPALRPGLL